MRGIGRMGKMVIVACLGIAVIAGTFLVQRGRNRAELEAKARLQEELERKRADIEAEQSRTGVLESRLSQAQIDSVENERKAHALAAADAEIRKLLGPEGYEYFDWYERSDPERERVHGFRSQFADEGHPLTGEQEQQLALAMFDERQRVKLTIDYNDPMALDFSRTQ